MRCSGGMRLILLSLVIYMAIFCNVGRLGYPHLLSVLREALLGRCHNLYIYYVIPAAMAGDIQPFILLSLVI